MSSRSALVVGGSGGIGLGDRPRLRRGVARGDAGRPPAGSARPGRRPSLGNATRVAAVVADAGSPVALDRRGGGARAGARRPRPGRGRRRWRPPRCRGLETSAEDVTAALERDVGVPWQVLRSSIGALREPRCAMAIARFVVMGSVAGLIPVPGFAAYSAAKAALRSLGTVGRARRGRRGDPRHRDRTRVRRDSAHRDDRGARPAPCWCPTTSRRRSSSSCTCHRARRSPSS